MKSDYSRSIQLICPTCANSQFSFDESTLPDERIYKCTDCGKTHSHRDVIDANSEIIQNTVEEVKSELVKDIRKDFKNMFKKFK